LIHPRVGHVHHGGMDFHLTCRDFRSDIGTRKRFIESGFSLLRQPDNSKLHDDSKTMMTDYTAALARNLD